MINISVLDSDQKCIAILDKYKSFIWTDRYDEAGEFELCIPVDAKYAQSIKEDMFLTIPISNRMMVVETIKVEADVEDGNYLVISGRSIESILDRRIVWKQTNVNGSVQDALHLIINDAIIDPIDSRRRIDNFIFYVSDDPAVTSVTYSDVAQYKGDSIYDVVKKVCQAFHIGFKMVVVDKQFVFGLRAGTNRSYTQDSVPYVVFSPKNDNLRNSSYLKSIKNYKNVLRVVGEGEGATKTEITHYVEFDDNKASEMTGLARREAYVDCSNVSSIINGNVTMDVEQYSNTLVQKGYETMIDYVPETAFDGEIDATNMYVYGRDYDVGDICEIRNEYGMNDQVRVIEVVQTWEADGYTCIPTLESMSKEEIDYASKDDDRETIVETIETTSVKIETAGLAVKWTDPYGSSEDASITYLTHSDVKMTTQLMSIKYYSSIDQWQITILKDHTSVKNNIDGTTVVYNRMRTINWTYNEIVNYEVSYTN